MRDELLSAVELCVSSREVDSVSSLLNSLNQSAPDGLVSNGQCRVQLHVASIGATNFTKLALPMFPRVSVVADCLQQADSESKAQSIRIAKLWHRPKAYEALSDQGISSIDSLGLTTLLMPETSSAADFAEDILGMELLAVLAIDAGTDDHLELYFYGFRRLVSNPSTYRILELERCGQLVPPDLGFEEVPHLAAIRLGPTELAFFAERIGTVSPEPASIDLRDDQDLSGSHVVERAGLGVFSVPLAVKNY